MMELSSQGMAALIGFEGIEPAPYLDSRGVWTFGVGHTAAAGAPDPKTMPRGMPADLDGTITTVLRLFDHDRKKYEAEVLRAVTVSLAQYEFDALVSFHYNTGAIARAKLTKLLNAGDRYGAGMAFMGWAKNPELRNRRQAESTLFLKGIYPTGRASVWPVDKNGRITWKPVRSYTPDELRRMLAEATSAPPVPKVVQLAPTPAPVQPPTWGALFAAFVAMFRKG